MESSEELNYQKKRKIKHGNSSLCLKNKSIKLSPLENLIDDIFNQMIEFLDLKSLLRLRLVNRKLSHQIGHPIFLKKTCPSDLWKNYLVHQNILAINLPHLVSKETLSQLKFLIEFIFQANFQIQKQCVNEFIYNEKVLKFVCENLPSYLEKFDFLLIDDLVQKFKFSPLQIFYELIAKRCSHISHLSFSHKLRLQPDLITETLASDLLEAKKIKYLKIEAADAYWLMKIKSFKIFVADLESFEFYNSSLKKAMFSIISLLKGLKEKFDYTENLLIHNLHADQVPEFINLTKIKFPKLTSLILVKDENMEYLVITHEMLHSIKQQLPRLKKLTFHNLYKKV